MFWRRPKVSSIFQVGARGRAFTRAPPSPPPPPHLSPSLIRHLASVDVKQNVYYYHQNDSCIKMGSDESPSECFINCEGQNHKTVSTNHNLFEEKGELKRNRAEVLLFSSCFFFSYTVIALATLQWFTESSWGPSLLLLLLLLIHNDRSCDFIVVHGIWSYSHCNRSDTRSPIPLLEL